MPPYLKFMLCKAIGIWHLIVVQFEILVFAPLIILQVDFEKKDKAYILLGILADSYNCVKDEGSFAHYLSKGKAIVGE